MRMAKALYASTERSDVLKPYGIYDIDIFVFKSGRCGIHAAHTAYVEIFGSVEEALKIWHVKPQPFDAYMINDDYMASGV